ncbi:basic proline-rich protein-like [Hyaena hyaena]|uniref:basic proline-rich protein-like n=1 Tax=Hyaena hyaena TaxID=95912 RepID=UPI0019224DD1|nr:basic proline-rich protein-like [Hyaena hyaena]
MRRPWEASLGGTCLGLELIRGHRTGRVGGGPPESSIPGPPPLHRRQTRHLLRLWSRFDQVFAPSMVCHPLQGRGGSGGGGLGGAARHRQRPGREGHQTAGGAPRAARAPSPAPPPEASRTSSRGYAAASQPPFYSLPARPGRAPPPRRPPRAAAPPPPSPLPAAPPAPRAAPAPLHLITRLARGAPLFVPEEQLWGKPATRQGTHAEHRFRRPRGSVIKDLCGLVTAASQIRTTCFKPPSPAQVLSWPRCHVQAVLTLDACALRPSQPRSRSGEPHCAALTLGGSPPRLTLRAHAKNLGLSEPGYWHQTRQVPREPFLLKSLPPGMSLLLTPPARVWCPGSEKAGENADGRLAAHCTPARHLEEPLGEPSSGSGPTSLTEMAVSSGPGGVSRGQGPFRAQHHPEMSVTPGQLPGPPERLRCGARREPRANMLPAREGDGPGTRDGARSWLREESQPGRPALARQLWLTPVHSGARGGGGAPPLYRWLLPESAPPGGRRPEDNATAGEGAAGSSPSRQEGPRLLALSPRGQALQGKQKSVVNTVPNPKWLLPSCNPIKVRLVYLSSSGLFITEQMAATFGRLRRPPPATRRAKLSSTESGPAPVWGRERRPPGARGPVSPSRSHAAPAAELVADGPCGGSPCAVQAAAPAHRLGGPQ